MQPAVKTLHWEPRQPIAINQITQAHKAPPQGPLSPTEINRSILALKAQRLERPWRIAISRSIPVLRARRPVMPRGVPATAADLDPCPLPSVTPQPLQSVADSMITARTVRVGMAIIPALGPVPVGVREPLGPRLPGVR